MCEHNPMNKGQSYCAYCRVNEQDAILKKIEEVAERWTRQGGFMHVRDAGIEILKILDTTEVYYEK